MEFYKMHGLGNDFVIFQSNEDKGEEYNELAKKMCDRHLGVGADGLMIALPSNECDTRMRIINADGSEAEMCGNGIRCFAKYVYEQGIVTKEEMTVETLAGIMVPKLLIVDGMVKEVTVDMGEPVLESGQIPVNLDKENVLNEELIIKDKKITFSSVLMGVPHTVVFCDTIDSERVKEEGPLIEKHPIFPQKTNVNFATVHTSKEMTVRTWERGAGVTLACGTGCCGSVVLGALTGKCERKVKVYLYEGTMTIEWREDNNHVYMTGSATMVFKGEWASV